MPVPAERNGSSAALYPKPELLYGRSEINFAASLKMNVGASNLSKHDAARETPWLARTTIF
jgi:hypothetical protein